jgi:hypothetical protein
VIKNPFLEEQEKTYQQIEFAIHCAIVDQLPAAFPSALFWHTPNRPGDAKDGYFKKMMGAKKGASDLAFSWNLGKLQCGWLELKAPGKKLESAQNKWLSSFAHIGWHTGTARSVGEAFNVIERWGIPRAHRGVKEPDTRTEQKRFADSFDFFMPPPSE